MKLTKAIHRSHPHQIYRLNDDGSGNPRYFFIAAMEDWARANLDVVGLKPCVKHAQFLLESGAIDINHFQNVTIRQQHRPILVCQSAGCGGGTVIVDGNHRFVWFTLQAENALNLGEELAMEAYVLSPDQWRKFIVPPSEVAQLNLH